MAILTWDQYLSPVLQVLQEGSVLVRREIVERVAIKTGVTDEERGDLIRSGQPRYINRIDWAINDLHKADCLDRPKRAHYVINELGRKLHAEHPGGVLKKDLNRFAEAHGIQPPALRKSEEREEADIEKQEELTPTEQIEAGVERLHETVAADLLDRLHANDPEFFEQAVLDLLIAMGYGGTKGKATRTQLSNDGGIDGVIDQDALGLSRIYVQAKRYALDRVVGRPDIQAFVGALHGEQAHQGVFITTGQFSNGAVGYAENLNVRVVLIDGARLAQLMIRFGVGVQVKRTVAVVEVDEDFFEV
ncbi:restriction endonuclease [Corynebacterium nasicanis]|uniref:Restriction endonuclease n=1 Tax=Corynebacterium nasicanis TaxID=1448267 RepID=A0ABW1QCD6_9CORY